MQSSDFFVPPGQRVVITGGAGVLLSPLARFLACEGKARVAVVDLAADAAADLAASICSAGGDAIALTTDVTNVAALSAACEQVVQKWGGLDVLINGAGGNVGATTTKDRPIFEVKPEDWRRAIALNLDSAWLASQAFGKVMADAKEGLIINVASMTSFAALTNVPVYGIAKTAIVGMTRQWAVELGLKHGPNLRVNAIAPGFIHTQQNHALVWDDAAGGPSARGKLIIAHTPAGRMLDPEDMFSTFVYLMCRASRAVNSVVVPVDGGFSGWWGV
jgi:NAD(P)-dependent dehydrogenase (short-subunit alcohol dehydrogenase family)